MSQRRILWLFLLANLAGAAVQGCVGVRPAGAAVGDNISAPLWRIADACERIAKSLEKK